MNTVSKQIVNWANKTDMKTIPVGMLKDWVLEMEEEELEQQQADTAENDYLSDILVLKIVFSYLVHKLNAQPSIDINDLAKLNPEDLIDHEIPKELFTTVEYKRSQVENMKQMLSRIIQKMEDKHVDNI